MSKRLPSITSDIPRDLRTFIDRLREMISSNGSDRLLSVKELKDAGVIEVNASGAVVAAETTAFSTPPPPTNVVVTSSVDNAVIMWDDPIYPDHAYAEVWGADTDSISGAVLLGQAPGFVYVDSLGPGKTRYYWVRFVNTQFTAGAYNSTTGSPATTVTDLARSMDALADAYGSTSAAPFFQLDAPQVIGDVTIPAGTYMKAAFIYDGVISNAKLGNAVVDTAKIADAAISTAKIADAAINEAKIADAVITSAKIADANITEAKIADAAITRAKIANAAISSAQIDDAAITFAKIDVASIDSLSAITQYVGEINMQRDAGEATYIRYGKTSFNDIANDGFWIGVDASGNPGVAIGGQYGLFKYTYATGLQVAGTSVSVVQPGSVVASSGVPGTMSWTNNTGLYTTYLLRMIGGGGGGGGIGNDIRYYGSGGAGGNTTATIYNASGGVVATVTANGGAGGSGRYSYVSEPPIAILRTPVIITSDDGHAGGGGWFYYLGYAAGNGAVGGYVSQSVTIPLGGSITITVGDAGAANLSYDNDGHPGHAGSFSLAVVGA